MGEDRIIDINKAKEREEFLDRKGKDIPDPRMIGNPNIDQLKELMKFLPTATEIPDTATMNQSEQKQNKRSTGLGDILANIGKLAFAIPFAPAINAY